MVDRTEITTNSRRDYEGDGEDEIKVHMDGWIEALMFCGP
jgi:hypothetical protein